VRFGIFLGYQRIHAPEHYGDANLYDEMLEKAKLADELGFEILWVPEHHMIHLQQAPSATLIAMQLGLSVSCQIGTMVVLPTYRHPVLTAGEIAVVDNALHGRLEVGLGRGAYRYEFERIGVPFAEGKERFVEALDILEALWHSEDAGVSYDGKFHQFEEAYVWPRPYQRPHPPVWVAAMTPPTIDWAVRKGYHVASWPFLRDMSAVASLAGVFHEAREETGGVRGEQRLGILRATFAAGTEKEAASHVEEALINHRINQRLHHFTQNADPRGVVAPEPVENEPTPGDIYQNLIMGTAEQCLEKVERYHELGVDDLLTTFDWGPSHEAVKESMRIFAEGVIRPFRQRHGIAHRPGVLAAANAA
jgi:alkanesulfonate monooxygenase SsuD/methylene tetrahydromethanopterin reductase-like flavin-dependent oxidoreductase (luciferase family)